jgi:signal transduction histidine kinase
MLLKKAPIRRKLIRIMLLTSGAVLLLTCTSSLAYELLTFRQTMVAHMSTLGQVIATNSTAALAFQNRDDAKEILAALKAEPHIVAACLYNKDKEIFSTYPENLDSNAFPAAPENDGHRFARSHLIAFHAVVQGDQRVGTLYLKSDMGEMYDRLRRYAEIGVLVVAASILLAYFLSRQLQNRISRPILALAKTARAVADHKDYSVRAIKLEEDEFGLLTDGFNHMLSEIEELHRELEQRVEERTRSLNAANKELEAFSYSVSHDLRAPLRHINGFSQALLEDYEDKLDSTGKNYLQEVRQASQEMAELIDDMLQLARVTRSEMRHEVVNLSELAQSVLAELQERGEQRNAAVKIEEGLSAVGDKRLLRVVLTNLLGNAWKFTSRRKEAEIAFGEARKNGDKFYFVRDNGAGFDMAYADKLFGAFQRLHTAGQFEGTGIGLATVQRIVHRHGGCVWAEAVLNEGATFFFSLPNFKEISDGQQGNSVS